MNIYIGADHRGFALKNDLMAWLTAEGHTINDVGAPTLVPDDDYPDFALAVARAVAEAPQNRRGIALCGSGVGAAVAANKVPGIRAALLHDPAIAAAARNDDDTNVLALGADYVTLENAKEIVARWLATPFSGEERHQRRLNKIVSYEHRNPSASSSSAKNDG
jgi:RpiB/LacA/LacB family sugar-phosphate isomerase